MNISVLGTFQITFQGLTVAEWVLSFSEELWGLKLKIDRDGILSHFNQTLTEKNGGKNFYYYKQMLESYDGLWLLKSGQLSDSAKVYYAKHQMVQIFSHRKAFIVKYCQ